MDLLTSTLRKFDFYRSTDKKDDDGEGENMFGIRLGPRGSYCGVCLSVCTLVLMAGLFMAELRSYVTVTDRYDVVLGQGHQVGGRAPPNKDATLQLNFNVSFPHLPCKFASVDIHDVTHTRRLNVTKNVRKFYLGKSGRVVGEEQHHETEKKGGHEVLDDDHPIHARMADPNTKDHSDFLTEKSYDDFVKSHDVVLVNFFAPWCHWCRRLEPVWEHTAGEVKRREYKNTVTFARVDCVKEAGLCRRHMVRAYPTILTYQQGKTDLRKMYRGDRSTAAFLDYVEHLDYVAERIKSGNWDDAKDLQEVKKDPKGESEGCQVTGVLVLKRVPGSLVFTAHSEWHNFDRDMIDVSHAVNELSFGDLALRSPRMMPHTNALDGTVMDAMGKKSVTHHHYMKLVETVFAGVWRRVKSKASGFMGLFGGLEQAYTYQYTKHSHSYSTPENKVAEAKFQFDIDPMAVQVSETKTSTMRFFTSLCAIIGGAYAVMAMVHGGVASMFG
jgi:protein disulfide-isomerase-like protein